MTVNEEKRRVVRALKYRTQELDAKLQVDKLDMSDIETRINEIYSLAEKLK
jgi:hypothetical protein